MCNHPYFADTISREGKKIDNVNSDQRILYIKFTSLGKPVLEKGFGSNYRIPNQFTASISTQFNWWLDWSFFLWRNITDDTWSNSNTLVYSINLSNTYPLLAIGAYPTDGVLDPLPLLRSGVFSVAIILEKIWCYRSKSACVPQLAFWIKLRMLSYLN
jgi:hypothetical protein